MLPVPPLMPILVPDVFGAITTDAADPVPVPVPPTCEGVPLVLNEKLSEVKLIAPVLNNCAPLPNVKV